MHPSHFLIADKFSTNFLSDSDTGETPYFKIKHIKPNEIAEGTTKSSKKAKMLNSDNDDHHNPFTAAAQKNRQTQKVKK